MKFKHLAYSDDEEIYLIYTEHKMQLIAKGTVGRELKPRELSYLKDKIYTNIVNLIIKIYSSGIRE